MEFKDYAFQELDKAGDWYLKELLEDHQITPAISTRDCAEYWIKTMAERVLIPENAVKVDPKALLQEYLTLKGAKSASTT